MNNATLRELDNCLVLATCQGHCISFDVMSFSPFVKHTSKHAILFCRYHTQICIIGHRIWRKSSEPGLEFLDSHQENKEAKLITDIDLPVSTC
jgi:hypothetical protein